MVFVLGLMSRDSGIGTLVSGLEDLPSHGADLVQDTDHDSVLLAWRVPGLWIRRHACARLRLLDMVGVVARPARGARSRGHLRYGLLGLSPRTGWRAAVLLHRVL